jgi:nucleotide-binding universal stress UspA family protein
MTAVARASAAGPIVFAYDGSDLAKLAIDEAGTLLGPGRDALVVTVWKPFDVGFVPVGGRQFDAEQATDVKDAAAQTAADGASRAEAAGFRAQSLAIQASPAWKGIVELAEDRDSCVIVLGSHGRRSLHEAFLGSVASSVAARSRRSVLIVHRRS